MWKRELEKSTKIVGTKLTFRPAATGAALVAALGHQNGYHTKFDERTGNVYENKRPVRISTTPGPSLSKEGSFGLPSPHEDGMAVVRAPLLQ